MGRPSEYTEALAAEVLAGIATTNKGLATLCEENPNWPEPRTIYRWLMANDTFCQRYARAKEDQTQVLEDEMLAIADTPQIGEIVTDKGDKVEIRRGDMIEHRRLRIEARKWLMGKLKPKKYGDKTAITGEDGGPVVFKLEKIGNSVNKPGKNYSD